MPKGKEKLLKKIINGIFQKTLMPSILKSNNFRPFDLSKFFWPKMVKGMYVQIYFVQQQ